MNDDTEAAVTELGQMAALMYRTLRACGVPDESAAQITEGFVGATVMASQVDAEPPRETWQT